jgi:flagellar hook-length control protein FliK
MKTSDVSSKQPVQGKAAETKTEQKQKSGQKQFKEVLQEAKPKQVQISRSKPFSPLEKKSVSSTKGEGKPTASKSSLDKTDGEPKIHSRIEAKEERENSGLSKHGMKSEQIETPNLPNPVLQQSVQSSTAVQGVKAVTEVKPALNLQEIESIVQRVHVGVNEKGLPEMNFELKTENLGNLSLKVNAENDKIRIEFVTHDSAAQDVLNQNLRELTQTLHNKGLNIAELNVMTRDQRDSQQERQEQSSENGGDSEGFGFPEET